MFSETKYEAVYVMFAVKVSSRDDEIPTDGADVRNICLVLPKLFSDAMIGDLINRGIFGNENGSVRKIYRIYRHPINGMLRHE